FPRDEQAFSATSWRRAPPPRAQRVAQPMVRASAGRCGAGSLRGERNVVISAYHTTMEAGAEFSASRSLIDEIRLENQRLQAERESAARRRRRRNVTIGVAIAVSLVALGAAVRHTAERRRIEGRLEVAQAALAADRPAELQRAADALVSNLAVEPAHDDSLGLLAMVRVHQFAEGWITQAEAEDTIARAAEANSPHASLARGMLAGLLGDFDQARRSYEAHAQGSSAAAVRNDTAWLRGVAALGRPYERDVVTGAATAVRT